MNKKLAHKGVVTACMSTMSPASTKLTKRIFLTAPTSVFLVSNCLHNPTKSIFEEWVEPAGPARARQWQRIVLAGASQRLCRVFHSKEDYQRWLSSSVCPRPF